MLIQRYPGTGNNTVKYWDEAVSVQNKAKQRWILNSAYFSGVTMEISREFAIKQV